MPSPLTATAMSGDHKHGIPQALTGMTSDPPSVIALFMFPRMLFHANGLSLVLSRNPYGFGGLFLSRARRRWTIHRLMSQCDALLCPCASARISLYAGLHLLYASSCSDFSCRLSGECRKRRFPLWLEVCPAWLPITPELRGHPVSICCMLITAPTQRNRFLISAALGVGAEYENIARGGAFTPPPLRLLALTYLLACLRLLAFIFLDSSASLATFASRSRSNTLRSV